MSITAMSFYIPSPEYLGFIKSNEKTDVSMLRMKCHGKPFGFNLEQALIQIECRQRCRLKLKNFISDPCFMFPSVIAAEQSSHQAIAVFHASLTECNGTVLDMTSGLGIDAITISGKVNEVIACELDPDKAEALAYNCKIRNINNIEVKNCDSIEFLKSYCSDRIDVIFIDPARRGTDNSRLYNLKDCLPDVLGMMPLLEEKGIRILIKASPLLDISQTLRDIPGISAIRAISVSRECKEVLIEIDVDNRGEMILAEAIDLDNNGNILSKFSYHLKADTDLRQSGKNHDDRKSGICYISSEDIHAGSFLFEPGATLMKLAPWPELQTKYPSLKKLGKSSHLFIGDILLDDFPGRKMKIISIPDKMERKSLKNKKVNIVARNYPLTADELRKKLGTHEGKDSFLYATRIGSDPIMILADRIK